MKEMKIYPATLCCLHEGQIPSKPCKHLSVGPSSSNLAPHMFSYWLWSVSAASCDTKLGADRSSGCSACGPAGSRWRLRALERASGRATASAGGLAARTESLPRRVPMGEAEEERENEHHQISRLARKVFLLFFVSHQFYELFFSV